MAQPVMDHLKRKRTVSFEATDFDLDFKQYNSDHWRSNIILRWRGDSERGKIIHTPNHGESVAPVIQLPS